MKVKRIISVLLVLIMILSLVNCQNVIKNRELAAKKLEELKRYGKAFIESCFAAKASTILRGNLAKAGEPCAAGEAAHHIIASTERAITRARDLFKGCKDSNQPEDDMNEAINGVCLDHTDHQLTQHTRGRENYIVPVNDFLVAAYEDTANKINKTKCRAMKAMLAKIKAAIKQNPRVLDFRNWKP